MAHIDYQEAKYLLIDFYQQITENVDGDVQRSLSANAINLDVIFNSKTQSYREALLGCALIHLIDPSVNIRLPYINHGKGSFSGRHLDEYAVNPFLQEQLFPCSKGPYLAAFRRSVKLTPETSEGLRDKDGYAAMMELLAVVEKSNTKKKSEIFIKALLQRFILLRNASIIPLAKVNRFNIEQHRKLLTTLLHHQSGGLLPVIITVAFFQMLSESYSLNWDISWQGINVADRATGAEGDITIKAGGKTVLAIEITERPLDQRRITSTFNTKIILNDVKEYLFIYTNSEPDETALQTAKSLFSQGFEINFANAVELIINNFFSLPSSARETFINKILILLDNKEIPSAVKVQWNESVKSVLQT
jgi:hypothetical protein